MHNATDKIIKFQFIDLIAAAADKVRVKGAAGGDWWEQCTEIKRPEHCRPQWALTADEEEEEEKEKEEEESR